MNCGDAIKEMAARIRDLEEEVIRLRLLVLLLKREREHA
jgi:hypothetical protein